MLDNGQQTLNLILDEKSLNVWIGKSRSAVWAMCPAAPMATTAAISGGGRTPRLFSSMMPRHRSQSFAWPQRVMTLLMGFTSRQMLQMLLSVFCTTCCRWRSPSRRGTSNRASGTITTRLRCSSALSCCAIERCAKIWIFRSMIKKITNISNLLAQELTATPFTKSRLLSMVRLNAAAKVLEVTTGWEINFSIWRRLKLALQAKNKDMVNRYKFLRREI